METGPASPETGLTPAGEASTESSRQQKSAARIQRRREARTAWRQTGVGWRVLPRTLLGICFSLLVFGVGVGVAGAVLFVYYDSRLESNEAVVVNATNDLDRQTQEAVSRLDAASTTGAERLERTLGPYGLFLQDSQGLPAPVGKVAPSLVRVATFSTNGDPASGTAVAVGSSGSGTLLVTSLRLVAAQQATPAPELRLETDSGSAPASLWRWDEQSDLALLVSDLDVPAAEFASLDDITVSTGAPVFAASAFNNSATPGVVVALAAGSIRHNAALGSDFFGGPVVDAFGNVIAFTTNFSPGNYQAGGVPWAPTIESLCGSLASCSNDTVTAR